MAMVVIDKFLQRLFIIPTWKKAIGAMVAEQFHDEITCREVRGVPRELISDRDIRFTSNSKNQKYLLRGIPVHTRYVYSVYFCTHAE